MATQDDYFPELTPDLVMQAYRHGIFPMAESRDAPDLHWYDPPHRGILPIRALHVPARLRRLLRQRPFTVSVNRDFAGVICACATARPETWINDNIVDLYTALHRRGDAHSVEVRDAQGQLVGGVYGIAAGGAFFGESMFSTRPNASKVALICLVARLWRRGFVLFDTQFVNPHLTQFGCHEIPRAEYLRRLEAALRIPADFTTAMAVEECLPARHQSSGSVSSSSSKGAAAAGTGAVSVAAAGSASVENDSVFAELDLFLHEITQTS